MTEFDKDLEDLIPILNVKKDSIIRFLKKNYKKDIHYIFENNTIKKHTRGGSNKIIIKLTIDTYELIKNSYNLRNRYIVNISDNIKCINNISMCIENQTIGFIWNCFNTIITVKRQYKFKKYKVDLYFPDYKLVIECDENNHDDRDQNYEKIREDYIISLNNKILRFNPNSVDFDLSNIIKDINKHLFNYNK
jgi:very-short-patch-repair endonuclease